MMSNRIPGRTTLLAAISFCLFFISSSFAERPSLYGFSLGYPKQMPVITSEAGFPSLFSQKDIELQLTIDKKGKVKTVRAINTADSAFAKAIGKYVTAVPFEPGLTNGKPIDCNLITAVQIIPNGFRVSFAFPVDSQHIVSSSALYFRSLEANGIGLPRLISFPSYWSNLTIVDSMSAQKFILLKLTLGKTGSIEDVSVVRSNYPAFESQLVSAATRAIVAPPTVKGKPIPASVFLALTFYPGNNYPTMPFTPESASLLPLRERLQLFCFADTLGLLSGPIPKFNPAESITGGSEVERISDTVAVMLSVNAAGKGGCLWHDDVSPALSKWIRSTASWMRFYPALTYSGEQSEFTGTTYFIFSDSTAVRIVYPWLQ